MLTTITSRLSIHCVLNSHKFVLRAIMGCTRGRNTSEVIRVLGRSRRGN
jgi:hypothetical protein